MRDEGWQLFRQGQKPLDTRKHEGTLAVKESDTRWYPDGLELSSDNEERVRVAFALDCYDREIMSWIATTKGISGGLVMDLMKQAVEKQFGSNRKRSKTIARLTDNGSCYTAAETRSIAKEIGLKPVTTPVKRPQSNGMAESFVNMLKRDYAKLAYRSDSKNGMAQLKD
jgi:putative transposase